MHSDRSRPIDDELERLRAHGERYAALVENSPYCIHEIDADGRLISMNPAGLRMMGVTQECAVVGTAYLDAVSEPDRERIASMLERALDGGFFEYEFTAVNGRRFRSNFVPLPPDERRRARLMGITQDITERRELERQLRRDRSLDAIGRLAGGVAHDFNNLLTVIMGAAEALDAQVDGSAAGDVEAIRDAAARAARFTSQLLTIARKQVVRARAVDVRRHIEQTGQLIRRLVTENIDLIVDPGASSLVARIDPSQLDQLLLNLAANARDAMPDGGELHLTADRITLDTGAIRDQPQLAPGEYVLVELRDTGHGMPEESRNHLFEPFYTTKPPGQGTGLGLATCYGIARQAGGGMRVLDAEPRGTRFQVFLPTAAAEPELESETRSGDRPATRRTVLVAEDSELVRETVVRALELHGYLVLAAESAEDALRVAGDHEGPIDLLLTDVVLPGLNGKQLADRFLDDRPGTPVLYTSGYTDDVVLHSVGETSDLNFLPKPYGPSVLLAKIDEVLDADR